MNKRVRAMVGNKIRGIAAWSAAQFRGVRAQMAKDRHHADMMLSQASARMTAALNANAALQNKRFAKTVADINQAKAESNARIAVAKKEFKMNLLNLGATVRHQVGKLNSRVTQLQGVITKNRLEQARVNRNVNAEMKRMVKLGNHREEVLAKHNKALHGIISRNKAEIQKRMDMMAKNFYMQISKIRAQAKKLELKSAIREAVNKGEQRAKKIEKMAKKMNKKTRDALSARVSTEIGTLTKSIHSDIEDLQLATKSARAQMRRQILYAVRSAAALAKRNR